VTLLTDDGSEQHALDVERILYPVFSTFSFRVLTGPRDFARIRAAVVASSSCAEDGRHRWPEWFVQMLDVLCADEAVRRDHGDCLTLHGRAALEHLMRRARALGAFHFICHASSAPFSR